MLNPDDPKQAHVAERLKKDLIVWLTSVRPNGRPHSVAVWFLWTGSDILIFSIPEQQKIRNIRHSPYVELALDDTKIGEDVIVIDGEAALVEDATLNPTMAEYVAKYAQNIKDLGWTPADMAGRYTQIIRITPTKFR